MKPERWGEVMMALQLYLDAIPTACPALRCVVRVDTGELDIFNPNCSPMIICTQIVRWMTEVWNTISDL